VAVLSGMDGGVDGLDHSGPSSEVGTLGGDPRGQVEGSGNLAGGMEAVSGPRSEGGTLGGSNPLNGMGAAGRSGPSSEVARLDRMSGAWPPDPVAVLGGAGGGVTSDAAPLGSQSSGIKFLLGGLAGSDRSGLSSEITPLGADPKGGTNGGGTNG